MYKKNVVFVFNKVIIIVSVCLLVLRSFNNYSNHDKIKKVSCGYWHTIVLKSDGSVLSWGANWYGQLGIGNTERTTIPSKVVGLNDIKDISCGAFQSLALKKDGTVWAWGLNNHGQLGNNTKKFVDTPIKIENLNNIIVISCGNSHCLAIRKDGTVWAWGYNNKGQIGDGTFYDKNKPTQVIGLNNVLSVSAGMAHNLALTKNGSIWAWGYNCSGQLGIGNNMDCPIPVKIDGCENIISISCGSTHSLALKKDGSLWGWGSNGNGQIGNEASLKKIIPYKIPISGHVESIACGDTHTIILLKDKTIYAFGGGTLLGNGTNKASSVPIEVNLGNIVLLNSNYHTNAAINKDSEVWLWGYNSEGQLGNGTTIDSRIPTKCCINQNHNYSVENDSDKYVLKKVVKKVSQINNSNNVSLKKTTPEDSEFVNQWGLFNIGQVIEKQKCKEGIDIDIIKAWDVTIGSKHTIVGVLDSGIDIKHNDLKDNVFINNDEIPNNGIDDDSNGFIDDINGWDFANNDNSVYDSVEMDSHGTAVAGIIAAGLNKKGIIGVAPNVKLLPLKFMNGSSGFISDIIKAIEYAKREHIDIFNCSWGLEDNEANKILEEEMKGTKAIFICAAGNKNFSDMPKLVFPACFIIKNKISVAAINYFGVLDGDSNYGDKIDVAAPGVGILTTAPNNKYCYVGGTSIATAFVSGIVALIKSYNLNISSYDIANIITNSVVRSKELEGKVKSNGRVDAYQALELSRKINNKECGNEGCILVN